MKRKLLIIALLASACGQAQEKRFDVTGFEGYYNDFVTAGKVTTDNLVIKFGKLRQPGVAPNSFIIGWCDVENGTPTVTIDKTYWECAAKADRVEVLWHELGHCVLGRQHDDRLLPDGRPASIMNTVHFNGQILGVDPVYYRDELFGRLK